MRRIGNRARIVALIAAAGLCCVGQAAHAQEPQPPGQEPAPPGGEPTPGGEPSPGGEATPPGAEATPPGEQAPAAGAQLGSISWRDIVTVPRRPILKYHRLELVPTYNVTINSPVVRHHGFGGIANFFLSETLNIALEATYYQPQQLEHLFLIGLDDREVPSVNRYFWGASFNFGYVPIYGKFALFNKWIFQWEAYIQAGIGVIQTQWIPRDPANDAVNNFDVLWHVDLGTRLFLTKWLAIHVYIKDYMMVDKLEPTNRPQTCVGSTDPACAGVSQFINNVVFGVGVGMFLPTGFEYKYTR
jgi:outer membrane beta-barrel protein